jgi:putative membrane protein
MPDYRMQLANERTFLAWQGMSLSLLAASIAVQSISAPSISRVWSAVGASLAVLATVCAVAGLVRWRHIDRRAQPSETRSRGTRRR